MLKIIQNKFPYDEIKLSFIKNKVEITFLYNKEPVASFSDHYVQYCDIHITQLEGTLRTTPS